MPELPQEPTDAGRDKSWDLADQHDSDYYDEGFGDEPYRWDNPVWLQFFSGIADYIVASTAPRTVLDVGCGIGFLVDALRSRGVDARGIDISTAAISQVPGHLKPYCAVGSITDPIDGHYDLITCIEVVEHLPPEVSARALDNLTSHTDRILFSSSPDDFETETHVNVRQVDDWVRELGRRGFLPTPDAQPNVVSAQAMLFTRRPPDAVELAASYEAQRWRLQTALAAARPGRREQARIGALEAALEVERSTAAQLERRLVELQSWRARPTSSLDAAPPRAVSLARIGRAGRLALGHLSHARSLIRRTRQVVAEEGVGAVAHKARRFLRAATAPETELAPAAYTVQGRYSGRIQVRYEQWRERHDPDEAELERQRQTGPSLPFQPLVSVIVPVFDPPLDVLRELLDCVLGQTYARIELCIANAGSDRACSALLKETAAADERVKLVELASNLGISGNSNAALELASGEFVALVDHDDLIGPGAIHALVEKLNEDPAFDVVYSDEDRLAPDGKRILPYLKPEWSPEFLHSYMWTGHLSIYRRSLVEEIGGFRSEFDGSQDYDLMLRAVARTDRIGHVPQVLYHWRMIEGSAAMGGKGDARRANLAALRDAIAVQGRPARIVEYPSANRVAFSVLDRSLVSIVIPTDDLTNARACIKGLLGRTSYDRLEIVVVTNPLVAATLEHELGNADVRCVEFEGPFNFSHKCNLGAAAAEGEYLLFLNDDVEPLDEGWLESMLQYAQLPEVGGVSPKLLYADDTIQYSGLVSGVRNLVGTAFHTWDRRDGGYHSMAVAVRNVSCLTGACLLLRAADFHRAGGWDAVNTPIAHSDFDLSYRLQDLGLRLVYTPFAELRHIGHVSRSASTPDPGLPVTRADRGADTYLLRRYGKRMEEDPYYPAGMRELLYEDETEYRVLAPAESRLEAGWWQRPRVLLVGHDLSLTGAPAMLLETALALERAGMLAVVTTAVGGPHADTFLAAGIPVILDGAILEEPARAARFMRGFDVIAANTVLSWRVVREAGALAVPVVWLIQEPRFGLTELGWAGPESTSAFAAAARVVFPSQATASLYSGFGHTDRHLAIHYGIPDAALAATLPPPFARDDGTFVIASVGSIEPRKGAHVLIDAVRRLPSELAGRVRIKLVGHLHEPEYIEGLKQDSDGVHVEFVGAVSREVALAYVQHADLFVCTSEDESGPVVVLEAMALGRPLITTAVGAAGEIVRSGIDGEVIEVNDSAALSERIERLALDPELRRRLGEEARATYERRLNAERYGDEITRVFQDVLADAGRPVAPSG